uniref:uncharacterized protein n=1 Tax=Myxine glutinosa TaxID=7769 RepID=UPI00358EE7B8
MATLARLGVAPFRYMAPALAVRPCLRCSSVGHAAFLHFIEIPACVYKTYSTLPSTKLPTTLSLAHQQQTLSEAVLKEQEGQLTLGEDASCATTKGFGKQDAWASEEPQQCSVRSKKKTIKKKKTLIMRDKEPAVHQDECVVTKDSAKQDACASEEPQQSRTTCNKTKLSKTGKLKKKDKEPAVPQDEDCQIHQVAQIKNISAARLGKDDLVSMANDAPDKLKYKKKQQKKTTQQKRYYTQEVAGVLAYLEACITTGELDLAQLCLQRLEKSATYGQYLRTSMYNILIHAWAKQGSLLHVAQLFSNMKKLMVKPDLSSYVGALECMGRAEHCPENILNSITAR